MAWSEQTRTEAIEAVCGLEMDGHSLRKAVSQVSTAMQIPERTLSKWVWPARGNGETRTVLPSWNGCKD